MTPQLSIRENIAVLNLGESENRFSPDWLDSIEAHLDEAEKSAQALLTIGTGKFYSNGLDLDFFLSNPDRADWYVDRVQKLFARVLTFPMPTLAAVNGHAFGAGAMIAMSHDFRLMREDRGYFCFPEVDINIPFTPGMAALIQAKVSPQTAVASMTTGHRYGGPQAAEAGLVDGVAAEDQLLAAATERLTPLLGKTPDTVRAIKTTMFTDVVEALGAATG